METGKLYVNKDENVWQTTIRREEQDRAASVSVVGEESPFPRITAPVRAGAGEKCTHRKTTPRRSVNSVGGAFS